MFNRKGTVPRVVRNFGILIIEVFFKLGNLVKQTEKANPMLVSSLGTMRIISLATYKTGDKGGRRCCLFL